MPPTITVTPSDYPDVVATPSGTLIPMITLGGGAEGWSAVAGTNPDGFLTFSSPTTVTGNGTLSIDYAANVGTSRRGTVDFTTSGGTGGPATFTLIIEQAGAAPTITVTPSDYLSVVASPAGTLMPNITLGGGAEEWTAVEGTNPDGFLTFSSPTTVTGDGTLSIDYAVNAGTSRRGTVDFTTSGGTGPDATFTLIIEQAGATPTITVVPDSYPDVLASPAGTLMPNITLGGGAEEWTAVAGTNPDGFLTFSSPTTVTGDGTLSIDYAANAGVARMGEVVFTTSGGMGPLLLSH